MSNTWPKIIRDPVHNIIPFDDSKCDKLLLALINTKEFQRLRRIKQLGLSQLVFPGADHSRFSHSIGVMHVARRILDRIAKVTSGIVNDDRRTVVLTAALLHDVGHGPFSHAFEKITGDRHETRTWEIISRDDTEINRVLRSFDSKLPDRLKVFFDEDFEESDAQQGDIPAFLTQVVSSQLDADRFDYLLRDSITTGTQYGAFDIEWLLQHIHVDDKKGRFYLGRKALYAAETYVFARYHMYRTVYYHKTTRAGEVMLRLLFSRYRECLKDCLSQEARRNVVPNAPPAVVRAFAGSIRLDEYLLLDDHSLTEFAKACMASPDRVLAELAQGLLYRQLFKATDVTELLPTLVADFAEQAKGILRASDLDPAFCFASDTPSDTAYKLYNPDAQKPATQIYIQGQTDPYQELTECSDSVRALTKKYILVRYYYPPLVRDRIRQEAEPLLKE